MNNMTSMPVDLAKIYTNISSLTDIVTLAYGCKCCHESDMITWEHGQEIIADAIRTLAQDKCQAIYEYCRQVDNCTDSYFDCLDTFASGIRF